ncbi:substrate-binding periplasmic protein [Rhodovibrionaceae bacterium A322]
MTRSLQKALWLPQLQQALRCAMRDNAGFTRLPIPSFGHLLALSVVLLTVFLSVAAKAETYRALLSHYPPNQYEEDGVAKGFNVELIQEVFRRLGHELEIEFVPWARVLGSLKSGDSDLAFAFYVPERTAYLDYSRDPIIEYSISLYALRDTPVSFDGDLASVSDKTIAAVRRTSYGGKFSKAQQEGLLPGIVLTRDPEISALMLLNKRVDLMVAHRFGAEHLFSELGRRDEVRELMPALQDERSFVVFSKANDLTDLRLEVDGALAEMRADGSYQKLLTRIFDDFKSSGPPPPPYRSKHTKEIAQLVHAGSSR